MKEYIDNAPSCRIFYRLDGSKIRIMAGQLTWTGKVESKDEVVEWLEQMEKDSKGRVIEVKGWKNVNEVFG
jgi:hypothetical protein